MNLDNIIETRKSVRKFSPRAVDKELIDQLIESARLAPSAANRQPWTFYVCQSDEAKRMVASSYPREWFADAPLYLIVCGNHSQSWKRPADNKDHCDIDIAIAVEHICLKAVELGLGTCWVCHFDPQTVCRALNLDADTEPIVLLPVGYPADDHIPDERNKIRKSADEIVRWI